jgi:hypothetical protein
VPAVIASSAPHYPPGTPGSADVSMAPDGLNGIWTLSFGRFGWKDYETRGAVIRIEDGKIFGGGSNFVYRGTCRLNDNTIEIELSVDRYRADPNFQTTTGLANGDHFHFHCILDAIGPDHFEGRVGNPDENIRAVLPEVRMAFRRFASLA